MFLTNIFKINKKCKHINVLPNVDFGYCPDCGKAIKNSWYLTRCSCCGVKLVTVEHDGKIHPKNKFCTNCGSHEYSIEKIENINVINVNYAVLIREELENENNNFITQCWQERINVQPKLLTQYL